MAKFKLKLKKGTVLTPRKVRYYLNQIHLEYEVQMSFVQLLSHVQLFATP